MTDLEKSLLDLRASFTLEAGATKDAIAAAAREILGEEEYRESLRFANDDVEKYAIGRSSMHEAGNLVILGDGDYLAEGHAYTTITVKFDPAMSSGGGMFSVGHSNFGGSALNSVRKLRDQLKEKLAPGEGSKKAKRPPSAKKNP